MGVRFFNMSSNELVGYEFNDCKRFLSLLD